jgi:hypothetical protein
LRGWTRSAFVAVALGLAPAFAEEPPGEVIDRAVAMVDGRVLTLSELEFEARVALVQAGGVEAATASLDDDIRVRALDVAIGQRLEVNEADKLQIYPLEEGEVETAIGRFQSRFPGPVELDQFHARHEADLQQLSTVLARGLRAAKILDGKLRLKAQVTDLEVRRYYDEHGAELGGSSYEDLRPAIRQRLIAERFKRLVAAELQQLRRSADVRLIAPFASEKARP